MLHPFRLHQFFLGEGQRHYTLLPKLSKQQVGVIERRLISLEYSVSHGITLRGKKGLATINVDPRGVSWSNQDLTDIIVPVIPDVLRVEKQLLSLKELENQYFVVKRTGEGFVVRFSLRMESSGWWKDMRAEDRCGLTPDEHAVVVFMLSRCSGKCHVLTDFPTELSEVKRIGRRQYYDAHLDVAEAALFLRSSSSKNSRNTYVPREGILVVQSYGPPGRKELEDLFCGLGDWCGYTVKRANGRPVS